LDVSTMMTSTQVLLIWILFSFLLTWLVIFTILALRPASRKAAEPEAHVTTTQPLSAAPPAPLEAISHEATSGSVRVG
jgi:hypothetical protein